MSDTVFSARTWRFYFNRHQAAPLVWCVAAEGIKACRIEFEVAVAVVVCHSPMQSCYCVDEPASDETGKPVAWFEAYGTLTLGDDGQATIRP